MSRSLRFSALPAIPNTRPSRLMISWTQPSYVRPLVEQTPIPLPRPAPRIQPQTAATNDQSPHSANSEQPTKAAANDVRDTRDNPAREAKQRQADVSFIVSIRALTAVPSCKLLGRGLIAQSTAPAPQQNRPVEPGGLVDLLKKRA